MLKYSIFVMLFVVLAYTANVHAILLAHEPFDYPDGAIHDTVGTNGPNGANGGIGWATGWRNNPAFVTSGSLTPPTGYTHTPTGGKIDMPAVGGSGANRNPTRQLAANLDMNPAVSTSYWVSVLAQRIDSTNGTCCENFSAIELRPGNNGNFYQAGWGTVNDGSDLSSIPTEDRQEMVVARNGTVNTYSNQAPYEIMNIGSTYLVLAQLIADPGGNHELRVKTYESGVDTISGIPETWDAIDFGGRLDAIQRFSANWGAATQQILLDEIRIGTTMADVVPEPATLSLLGLGALAAIRRRKR
jgi:hypothetical protein